MTTTCADAIRIPFDLTFGVGFSLQCRDAPAHPAASSGFVMLRALLVVALLGDVAVAQEPARLVADRCVRCHNPEKKKGGVDLTPLTKADYAAQRKLLRRVLEQIETRAMPPAEQPALTDAERTALLRWGRQGMAKSEPADPALRDPGPALVRRLNRIEYNRTLHDLVGMEFDVASAVGMPDDSSALAFDNFAEALNVSPVLMEKYFTGADLLLAELFRVPTDDKRRIEQRAILRKIVLLRPGWGIPPTFAARTIAQSFLPRAFRRPVTSAEVDRYVRLFETESVKRDFDASIRVMLKAALVSPHFLLRIEHDRPELGTKSYPLADRELAVRLSYFLWSSMPDAELFDLAAKNALSDPEIYRAQVKRMLADPKAAALTENFAGQWTRIRKLDDARPTIEFFPTFTPRLKKAMTDEILLFFDALRKDDRSILELLDADYTFVNDELARHYGIKDVKGEEMRKVSLKAENHRGGLASMAGVLAMTSHTNRTSPTLRGKWVLETIFGDPPEPPPANVGQIKEESAAKGKEVKTFRELLQRHASEASCAGCHKKIDPLGFGLENFDPIGRWRPSGGPQKVDASGTLPSGEKFNGAGELRKIFLARKADFVRNLAEQLVTYSLGRDVTDRDEAAIAEITTRLERQDFRFSEWVLAVAESYPFRWRKNLVHDRTEP
jgi:mono/diheme cytochrome c family protein